jgi:hypothetical protein
LWHLLQHLGDRPGVAAAEAAPKKKEPRAAEQDREDVKAARQAWRQEFATVDPARLVFLDETGTTTTMTRRSGRAPRGQRLRVALPQSHWKVLTLTAALRGGGVGACLAFDGATNTACLETYIARCWVPTLHQGDIVVRDNLACHKTAEVQRLIESAGAQVRYLPPSSPDFNPIEAMFSKVKETLRAAAARTVEALINAMGDALRGVAASDTFGWFDHCGYCYTQE